MVECHAILDGWSHNTLLGELLDRYRAIRAGSPLPVTPPARRYADFVALERRLLDDERAGRTGLDLPRLADADAEWDDLLVLVEEHRQVDVDMEDGGFERVTGDAVDGRRGRDGG